MEKEPKNEKDNNSSIEKTIKTLSKCLFLICVLLIILIIRIEKANVYLRTIAENGTNIIEYETFDDTFIEVETEEKKSKEDYVPLLEELTEENTKIENATKSTNDINDNSTTKKTYVLNTNSKKIHLPDCSFIKRTKEENKKTVQLSDEELKQYKNDGYAICKTCGGD